MGAPQYEQAGADIGGTGTTNTIPRWTGPSTLGDSVITQNSAALVTTGSTSASQTTFRVQTAGPGANLAPVLSLFRTSVNEHAIYAGTGSNVRLGFAIDPAGYTDAQLLAATKMGIDNSGNVGIGTASPVGRTDIAGTSVDQLAWGLLSVRSNDAQGADKGGSLAFGGLYDATNSTHWAQISGRKENGTSGQYGGYLAFATRTNGAGANTERARIDSAGNFSIGYTGGSWSSTYTGMFLNRGLSFMARDGGDAYLSANAIYDSSNAWKYVASGSTASTQISFQSGVTVFSRAVAGTAGSALTWLESARIDSAGNLILNTANTGATIQAAGTQQGLKLPATPGNADTQTLDCYQEGTWSPTLTGFGGTTPTVVARYTRIGRVVTLQVYLSATGGASFSSTATATYLSLPTGMTAASSSPGSTSNSGIAADGPCVAYNNGNFYLPTFALRTSDTFLNVTYTI